ncbi:hypothetical protein [Bradyrhizobium sp.]|uniref:hypothetical protein n=1 Tax=Bradyrhizobium sp. TaxID=376 RepID=UPI0040384807
MSSTNMDRSFRSVSRNTIPARADDVLPARFAGMIAKALRDDFGDTHRAVKTVCKLAGAHERAVKNWFDAENGPTGRHLVALMAVSDAVLEAVLLAAGRRHLVVANKIAESNRQLLRLLRQLIDLQRDRMTAPLDRFSAADVLSVRQEAQMTDPRDVIYAAIHSAFVKYPREDDPASHDHWIQPEESAHLTKVVLAELEANGFQIVKKSG